MSRRLTYEELEQRVRELEASKTLREQSGLDGLIESIQAGVVIHASDGAVIKSNTAAQIMLGLTHDQMPGKALIDPAWTFVREDGSPMPVEEYPVSCVIATKNPTTLVLGIQLSDKAEPIWVLDTAIPAFDENGRISQIVTTFMDISALKKSEEKYRNLFENTMHEVHLWKLVRDEHGSIKSWRLVDVNPAALKAWGKTRPEIIGKITNEIFSYDATEHFMPIVKKFFSEGAPYTWETYFPPTGQFLYMTSVPFGEYFMSTGTDITDRKQTEDALRDSEEKYRKLYEDAAIGIFHSSFDGRFLDVNPALAKMLGYETPQEVVDSIYSIPEQIYVEPQARDEMVANLLAKGETVKVENRYRRKDGAEWIAFLHLRYVSDVNGQPIFLEGFVEDITERKKTEEALKESEERHRLFYNPSFGGSIIHDKGVILDCSNGVTNITGYSHDELIGMDGLLLIAPDSRDFAMDKIASGFEEPYEAEGIRKDGTIFPLRLHAKTIQHHGRSARIVEFRDITEIKKKEEALKESETFLNETGKIAKVGGWKYDIQNEKLIWTKELYNILEVTSDFVPTVEKGWKFYHPDSKKILEEAYDNAVANGESYDLELKIITAKNNKKHVRSIGRPEKDKNGKVISIGGYFQDITERKIAENMIHALEKRNQALLDHSPVCHKIVDLDLNLQYMNVCGFKMLELEKTDELYDRPYPFDFFPEESCRRMTAELQKVVKTQKRIDFEDIACDSKGNEVWLNHTILPVNSEGGSIDYLTVVSADITERKQAEKLMRENKQRLEYILKGTNVGTWEWNVQTGETIFNETWANIIGYTLEDLSPISIETWMKYAHPDDLKKSSILLEQHFQGELEYYHFESRMQHKNGYWVWVLDRGKVESWTGDGKPLWMFGTHQDITERKHIEEKLKASERKYRNIAESMPGLILKYKLNPDGSDQLLYISKGVEDLYEVQIEDAIKNNTLLWSRIHKDDVEEYTDSVKKSAENLSFWVLEHRLTMPGGRVKWVHNRGVPTKQEDGSVIWDSLAVDITAQKQLESEKDHLIDELKLALAKVKKLEGFLPICSYCKKIRDDLGYWQQIEKYIHERSDAQFSHGICPECAKKHYPDLDLYDD